MRRHPGNLLEIAEAAAFDRVSEDAAMHSDRVWTKGQLVYRVNHAKAIANKLRRFLQ